MGTLDNAANQGAWVSRDGGAAMSNFISRTMQDNIQNVTDDFGSQESVAKVAQNATDALNVQKISLDEDIKNRQQIDGTTALDNKQKIDAASAERNRQQIKSDSPTGNQQVLPADLAAVNRALIESEARMQNIQEVAHEVGQRLDHFERDHFDFLQVGKAQRYDDSFALVDEGEPSQNRQFINTAAARLGLVLFAQAPRTGVDEEAASAKPQIASESGVAAVIQMADATPSHSDTPAGVFSKTKQYQPFVYVGSAFALSRRFSRLNYVQLVTAFLILTFAAPISTQTLSAQTAVGRLVGLPSLEMPVISEVVQN